MLEIRVKRDVLAKYNLHAGEVNQTIAAALGGQTVGTMIEGNRRFEIVVRLAESGSARMSTRSAHCRFELANPACCRLATSRILNASKRFRRFCATLRNVGRL